MLVGDLKKLLNDMPDEANLDTGILSSNPVCLYITPSDKSKYRHIIIDDKHGVTHVNNISGGSINRLPNGKYQAAGNDHVSSIRESETLAWVDLIDRINTNATK